MCRSLRTRWEGTRTYWSRWGYSNPNNLQSGGREEPLKAGDGDSKGVRAELLESGLQSGGGEIFQRTAARAKDKRFCLGMLHWRGGGQCGVGKRRGPFNLSGLAGCDRLGHLMMMMTEDDGMGKAILLKFWNLTFVIWQIWSCSRRFPTFSNHLTANHVDFTSEPILPDVQRRAEQECFKRSRHGYRG